MIDQLESDPPCAWGNTARSSLVDPCVCSERRLSQDALILHFPSAFLTRCPHLEIRVPQRRTVLLPTPTLNQSRQRFQRTFVHAIVDEYLPLHLNSPAGTPKEKYQRLPNQTLLSSISATQRSRQAVRSLGGVPGLVKSDLDPLLRRFDTDGDGRVSLPALMQWAGRKFLSSSAVANAVSEAIRPPRWSGAEYQSHRTDEAKCLSTYSSARKRARSWNGRRWKDIAESCPKIVPIAV